MQSKRPLIATAAVACALLFAALPGCRKSAPDPASTQTAAVADPSARAGARRDARQESFEIESRLISDFAGQAVMLKAVVRTPPGFDPDRGHTALYYVHGFGGTASAAADRVGPVLAAAVDYDPGLVVVFVDASHAVGHHVFADSKNTGPWASALVEELLPAIEQRYGVPSAPRGRMLAGHSSGGWSSLWLMINYPEVFGGVWATAPDPVDFRDFTGVDIYAFENMYRDPAGRPVQLRYRAGEPVQSLRDYVVAEVAKNPRSGQFHSFDAVFSPRGAGGEPAPLFNRQSGAIDREIASEWRDFDISWQLRAQWDKRGQALAGKLHVFAGTQDTFGLHRPLRLLATELEQLGSDAQITFVEGRSHFDLYKPDPTHFAAGLWARIIEEMRAAATAP